MRRNGFPKAWDLSPAGTQLSIKVETRSTRPENRAIPRWEPGARRTVEPTSIPAGIQETAHHGNQAIVPAVIRLSENWWCTKGGRLADWPEELEGITGGGRKSDPSREQSGSLGVLTSKAQIKEASTVLWCLKRPARWVGKFLILKNLWGKVC